MLTYSLLKNHAGILLVGDYQTLQSFHEVIHDINERSPIVRDKEGSFLGLAYDLRKAYEKNRKVIKAPAHCPEIGPRYGVEILWPVLLWQCRVLRSSLAFIDSNKHTQAFVYALEAVIEDALTEDFGAEAGKSIIAQWERIDPAHPHSEEALISRGGVYSSWSKSTRKAGLLGLIASLDPMYSFFYENWKARGIQHLLSQAEYDEWLAKNDEWPDPKW